MAATFTFDSAEEDWDLNTLHVLNSQLEAYLRMVCSLFSWIILFPFCLAKYDRCMKYQTMKSDIDAGLNADFISWIPYFIVDDPHYFQNNPLKEYLNFT